MLFVPLLNFVPLVRNWAYRLRTGTRISLVASKHMMNQQGLNGPDASVMMGVATQQTRVNKDWRERNARDKHEMPRNYWSYPIVAGVQLCVRGTELVVESVASSSLEARMLGARAGDVLVAVVRAPSDASTALRVVSTGACARLCRRVRLVLAAALMRLCTPLLTAGVTCRTGKG